MGEAYKGLTIRFAANTSALKKDLQSSNSILAQTNKRLRDINKGLRFDPENAKLLESKIDNINAALFESAQKMRLLREQERKLASDPAIDKLSRSPRELSEGYVLAKEDLAKCQGEIVKWKESISDITDEQKAQLKNLKSFESVTKKLSEIYGENKERVKELTAEYAPLNEKFLESEKYLNRFKEAAELAGVRTSIERTGAEMRGMVAQIVKADKVLNSVYARRNIQQLRDDIAQSDRELDRFKADMKAVNAYMDIDDGSLSSWIANFSNIRKQSKLLHSQINDLQDAISRIRISREEEIGKGFKDLGLSAEEAEKKITDLAVQMKEAEEAVRAADKAIEAFKVDPKSVNGGNASIEELEKNADAARRNLHRLSQEGDNAAAQLWFARANEDLQEMTAKLHAASGALKSLGFGANGLSGKISGAFATMRSFSAALQTNVTPAVSMATSYIVDSAEEIDSAYRDMRKTVDGTDQQFEKLKRSAMEFSSNSIISTDEILEIEAMGGQLGICVENLDSFAETVSNINVASDLEADEAAEDLGKLSNIMGLSSSQYERFGDALIRLGNNTATTESDIMAITMRFASVGTQVRMSADEILAWADAAGTTGLKAEAAGTAMQRTISMIEGAVASGGEELDGFAKVSGMSAEKFAEKWENDASGALLSFVAGLARIEDEGGSAEATLQSLGINGVRQKNLLEGLANEYRQAGEGMGEATAENNKLVDSLRMSEDAFNGVSDRWGKVGDAAREAEQKSEGFSGSLGIMKNNAANLASVVGDSLVPYMDKASDVISKAVDYWNSLSEAEQQNIIQMVAIAAAAGPALNMLSATGQALSSAGKYASKAKEAVQLFGLAMTNMVLTGPQLAVLGAGIAAIGTLGAMVYRHQKSLKRAERAQTAVSKAMSASIGPAEQEESAIDKLKSSLGMYEKRLDKISETQEEFAQSISDTFGELGAKKSEIDNYTSIIEELGSKTDRSATETQELNTAIEGMNEQFGTQFGIDEATGKVYDYSNATHETVESIDEFIDKFQEQNATAEQVDKLEEAQKVIDELGGKEELSAEDTDKLRKALELVNEECGTNFKLDGATGEIQDLGEEADIAKGKMSDLRDEMMLTLQTDAYTKLASQALESYTKQQYEAGVAQEKMQSIVEAGNEYFTSPYEGLRSGVAGLTEDYKVLTPEMAQATEEFDTATKAAEESKRAYEELSGIAASAYVFDVIGDKIGKSSEKVEKAFEKAGVSSVGFRQALFEAGVSVDQFEDINRNQWRAILDTTNGSIPEIIGAIQAFSESGESGLEEYLNSVRIGNQASIDAWKSLATDGSLAAAGVDFSTASESNKESYLSSFLEPSSFATMKSGAMGMAEQAAKGAEQGSKSFESAGKGSGADYAGGIESTVGKATSAANTVTIASLKSLADNTGKSKTAGSAHTTAFGGGVLSKMSFASMQAGHVSRETVTRFGDGDASPSGLNLALGFAGGITSGEYAAINAAVNLVAKALAAIRAKGKEGSPWKTTIENGIFAAQGLAVGIEEGSKDAVTAAGRLATDTINSLNKGITSASYEALQMNIDAAVKTGGVFDDMKANMVTKTDIQSAVEAAIAGKNLGSQSITQSVGNVTFNDDSQIRSVISDMIETILMKKGM